jgi:hypothetical protein
MRRLFFFVVLGAILVRPDAFAQRCGFEQVRAALIAKDPAWADKLDAHRASLQNVADHYIALQKITEAQRNTAAISAVPIIFHIMVDSAQFNAMGGTNGIEQRCDSQIAVLNRDFNHENRDSISIPSSWKSLYGNTGIHFALARKSPSGVCVPGYEIKIIAGSGLSDGGYADASDIYAEAKTAGSGLAAWDVTKYYNVWVFNFVSSSNLGITVPLSFTGGSTGFPTNQVGVCILYNTLGCTAADNAVPAGTGRWFDPYNLGRTLTHETGHFFEIWHPWGDDGGECPWSGGYDDGLSDTPPESNYTYGNPTYTITGGTFNDACKYNGTTNTQPIGIASLSFMEYVDDDAMHMFTSMQSAAMASMVLTPSSGSLGATGSGLVGESYSLTQNPELLAGCIVSVPSLPVAPDFNVFPNPTSGKVSLTINGAKEAMSQIVVINLLGQEVQTIPGNNADFYSIDLSGMSKGIYFIKCNFASGSITRKILLQ